jgi:hypothetical protein
VYIKGAMLCKLVAGNNVIVEHCYVSILLHLILNKMNPSTQTLIEIVPILILVGRDQSLLGKFDSSIEQAFYSWPSFEIWERLTKLLSIEEHELLGKGFVCWAKNHFHDGGSVSPIIGIFMSYNRKYPKSAAKFANWIIENSGNQWVHRALKNFKG